MEEASKTNSINYLRKFYEKYGDFKVHKIDLLNPENHWTKERFYSECFEEDLKHVNLRKIMPDELILDLENKSRLDEIEQKLKEKNWSYELWDTNSRGYHISIIFNDLKDFDIDNRTKIRKRIIEEFNCDLSKKNENTWLALEYAKHLKTGKEKTFVKGVDKGSNKLPHDIKNLITLDNLKPVNNFVSSDENIYDEKMEYIIKHPEIINKEGLHKDEHFFPDFLSYARQRYGLEAGDGVVDKLATFWKHSKSEIDGWRKKYSEINFVKERFHKWLENNIIQFPISSNEKRLITAEELINMDISEDGDIWLEKDFIVKRGITILGGSPGDFKSFLALHFGVSSITQNIFLDNVPVKLKVLYVDEENRKFSLRRRLIQLKKGYNIDVELNDLSFAICHEIKLDDAGKRILEKYILEFNPDLIILDSIVRLFVGKENNSDDVKLVFDILKPLIEKYGVSFLILHHLRKSNSNSQNDLRGSGDFSAFADVVMLIKKSGRNRYILSQDKNRHNECIEPICFNVFDTAEGGIKISKDNNKIEFLNVNELCSKDILDWVQKESIAAFKTKQVEEAMKNKKHSHNAVNDALKQLILAGKLEKSKHGNYKVNNLENLRG